MSSTGTRRGLVALGVSLSVVMLTACSSSDGTSNGVGSASNTASDANRSSRSAATGSSGVVTSASGSTISVPAHYEAAGYLMAPVQQHPPFIVLKGSSASGPDTDLENALASKLGLRVRTQVVTGGLEPVLAGLLSKRFDLFMGPVETVLDSEKQVDLISFMTVKVDYITEKADVGGTDPLQLCGKTIAFVSGGSAPDDAAHLSDYCVKQGKPKIKPQPLADTSATILALEAGRADAICTTSGTADSIVASDSALTTLDQPAAAGGGPINFALMVRKDSGLTQPLLAAMNALIKNGEYAAIMTKYELTNGMVAQAMLNPPLRATS